METQAIVVQGQQRAAEWTEARVELMKRTICPKGIGTDEFALFLEQCKRSGLDPLLKEAFCVPRKAKLPDGSYGTRHEFQPSEAGMLSRAERFPDFEGVQAAAVYAEDEIQMDAGSGSVVHRFNPAKRKGSLVGAWARLQRTRKAPILVWVDFNGYVQQSPMWSKIPTTMIEKVARVAALRKAYPEAFGGLYIREEMPEAEFMEAQPAPEKKPSRRQERAVEDAQVVEPAALPPVTAPRETVAREVTEAREKVERILGKSEPAPVVVAFGPHKGKDAASLTDEQLADTILEGASRVKSQPDATWAPKVAEHVKALEAVATMRAKREPGAEG